MALTRQAILEADDIKREEVQVPEWGGSVYIGTMTGDAKDEFELTIAAAAKNGLTKAQVRARLVAATAQDAHGALLFTAEDVAALGKKSAAALDRCATVAQRLNAMTQKDLEDIKGN